MKLFKSEVYEDLAEHFSLYFETQDFTYVPDKDSVNIVIDRDAGNFKENQYDEVLNFCQKNNVNLYVSNPTFEFWLMLHFEEILTEDHKKMYENRYVTSSKRYLDKRLNEICGYKKSKFNFKKFENNIYKAIEREKMFCEDIKLLKNNLGSNVGILVDKMLND